MLVQTTTAYAETLFTVRGPEYPGDVRMDYDFDILKLALDATIDTHGPYRLQKTPTGLNFKRAIETAQKGIFPNFFLRNMVTRKGMDEMIPVIFPVERGITGYRVALIKPNMQREIEKIDDFSDLRKFDIIQGIGWPDNQILRANGLRVLTGPSFPLIREMVLNNRAQLFLRGVSEIIPETQHNTDEISLSIEKKVLIHYPFPRFLFTAKENTDAALRIEAGLLKACLNGSFTKLWEKYFKKDIEALNLNQRKVFNLQNPFIADLEGLLAQFKKLPAGCRPLNM